jgi:2-amino-4-hydroxy-6-hydroxymethyldihydropteridine diphosphokinase
MKATVGLGSNLGDRLANLQFAIDSLNATTGTNVHSISPVYETDPVGGPAQEDYLNAVAVLKTILSPEQLLDATQQIELAAHREKNERWGPRTLDLDLLAMDDLIIDSENLVLPHPRAHERGFVLLPWSTLDPDYLIPGHRCVSELLAEVDISGVRSRPDLTLVVTQ